MAFQVQPTLSELRDQILAALGISREGADPTTLLPSIDARIRQAQQLIYAEYPTLAGYVEREFPVSGYEDYDVPDDMDPGRVQDMALRRRDNGEFTSVLRGAALADLPAWRSGTDHRYIIIDQIIRIVPAPDADTYDVVIMRYYQRPTKLVDDTDRVVVDGTAVAMVAELWMRQQLGMKVEPSAFEQVSRYLNRLKALQSDGSGVLLGGPRSVRGLSHVTAYTAGAAKYQDHRWRPW